MLKRDTLFRKAKSTKEQVTKDEIWYQAKTLRNFVNEQCKNAKKTTCDDTNSEKQLSNITDSTKIPDAFNKFFASIGSELKDKIDPLTQIESNMLSDSEEQRTTPGDHPFFLFRPTNSLELEERVKRISVHKASGIPRISSYLLRFCLLRLLPQLVHIVNMSLESSMIPTSWKKAIVTPIFKAGDPRVPGNYRPISTLPVLSKILEKFVHVQISTYLSDYNLLSPKQFGFRQGLSTTKAISTLLTDIYNNLNTGQFTKLCFIDVKKAFDTVSHSVLFF